MSWKRVGKFNNTRTYDPETGQKFDSMKEYRRYKELRLLEQAGEIQDLKCQVKFILIPTQRDSQTGKAIESECSYIADFTYTENGKEIVEDVKGFRTPVYKLKKKMMLYQYGIRIRET